MDESILDFLKRHLRAAGANRWEAIAQAAGVAKSLPRKIVYDDRKEHGPGVLTIQPLVDYFKKVERNEIALPELASSGRAAPAEHASARQDRRTRHDLAEKWSRQSAIEDRRAGRPE